jgi:tRNA-dihydrouridine synthase
MHIRKFINIIFLVLLMGMELHLAPLKNISCWAFRASIIGVSDSYTEMIPLKPLIGNNDASWNKVDTFPIASQRQWLQVLTHSLEHMAAFPQAILNFQTHTSERAAIFGVNLNAGCPDPDVIQEGNGAALLRRPTRIVELIKSFLGSPGSHSIPISVKLRVGYTETDLQEKKILNLLERLKAIDDPRFFPPILHFKHAKEDSDASSHWELLDSIFELDMPIVLNGNIRNPNSLVEIKSFIAHLARDKWSSLIKGIMLGKQAMADFNCFIPFNPPKNVSASDTNGMLRLQNNLKIHPPAARFLNGFKKFYPGIFSSM